MLMFIYKFFVPNNLSIFCHCHHAIRFNIEPRRLPFQFQFLRRNRNGCITIGLTDIIAELRDSIEIRPLSRT